MSTDESQSQQSPQSPPPDPDAIPEPAEDELKVFAHAARDIELAKQLVRKLNKGTDEERLMATAVQNLAARRNDTMGPLATRMRQLMSANQAMAAELQVQFDHSKRLEQVQIELAVSLEYAMRNVPSSQLRVPVVAYQEAKRTLDEAGYSTHRTAMEPSSLDPDIVVVRLMDDNEYNEHLAEVSAAYEESRQHQH